MSLGSWYLSRGRIDRPTFWLKYFLPITVAGIVATIIDTAAFSDQATSASSTAAILFYSFGPVSLVVTLLTLIPSVSSNVTRLHDTGRSAWWLLIGLIPIAGGITLIVFWALAGNPQPNKYGPPIRRTHHTPDPGYPQPNYGL